MMMVAIFVVMVRDDDGGPVWAEVRGEEMGQMLCRGKG